MTARLFFLKALTPNEPTYAEIVARLLADYREVAMLSCRISDVGMAWLVEVEVP
jgi:hypothetical protein